MKKATLALTCLALFLLAALILGAGLSMAQTGALLRDPRPSPTPDGLGPASLFAPESPNVPPLPDLVVTSIEVFPSRPIINEPVTVRVTIKNQGDADVPLGPPPQNFYTDLYVDPDVLPINLFQDGVWYWGVQAYWLPAGESYTLVTTTHDIFDEVRTYSLYAQVDTDNHVAPEQNENNNVLGPVHVHVAAPNTLVHQTHQDFQMGVASDLDISHPDGVMRRGIFLEPYTNAVTYTEGSVYYPDSQIDHPPSPPSGPTNVNQINPAMAGNGNGVLYAVWEDGRNGGVFNRDIYFTLSTDGGFTWAEDDIRVNDDDPLPHTANQNKPDLAYDPSRDLLYAVWQDQRSGDFDIYFSYWPAPTVTGWSTNTLLSIDPPTSLDANQLNPSIVVGPKVPGGGPVGVYVVWEDRRNGNDDVYLSRSFDGGQSWNIFQDPDLPPDNIFVTDDPQMTEQDQLAPSVGAGFGAEFDQEGNPIFYYEDLFVCWEDWRDPDHPEIYVARSLDRGSTFGIDTPVSLPAGESYRLEPSMAVSTTIEVYEYWDPELQFTRTVTTPISAVHVAWQENADEDADIYWAYATYVYEPPEACPYPYDFCFETPEEISGFVIDSEYALPLDAAPPYPIDPTWQGEVSVAPASGKDLTYCHADSTVTYTMGIFVAWSDARTYDDWRHEIRTRRIASPGGSGTSYEPCEDQATGVLNDNVKVYALRDSGDAINGPLYEEYKPAATQQAHPYLYAEGPLVPTYTARLWVVWDDDRKNNPLLPGRVQNRDVFAARWGMQPEGIYISPVIDSRAQSTWHVLSWWGVTEHASDLLMQTRFGDNAYPPREDVPTGDWTRWTGNPSSGYLGCSAGEGCYYDAPGRRIVDRDGNEFPKSRYIQYKVIIRGDSRLTALSQVTLYYVGPRSIYLPVVFRNY